MTLEECRKEIDKTDAELVRLFCARMDISEQVALYKKKNGLGVKDSAREALLLQKVSQASDAKYKEYTKRLYEKILELSCEYQETLLKQ